MEVEISQFVFLHSIGKGRNSANLISSPYVNRIEWRFTALSSFRLMEETHTNLLAMLSSYFKVNIFLPQKRCDTF